MLSYLLDLCNPGVFLKKFFANTGSKVILSSAHVHMPTSIEHLGRKITIKETLDMECCCYVVRCPSSCELRSVTLDRDSISRLEGRSGPEKERWLDDQVATSLRYPPTVFRL